MTFREPHEMHKRRFSRNLGVGLTLAAFVALVFALTVVKVMRGEPMQAGDGAAMTGQATTGQATTGQATEGADQ